MNTNMILMTTLIISTSIMGIQDEIFWDNQGKLLLISSYTITNLSSVIEIGMKKYPDQEIQMIVVRHSNIDLIESNNIPERFPKLTTLILEENKIDTIKHTEQNIKYWLTICLQANTIKSAPDKWYNAQEIEL